MQQSFFFFPVPALGFTSCENQEEVVLLEANMGYDLHLPRH